ncbi:MFS transporter [Bartonella pachyuromydis]|uniref:MFS transporter n=1 Tax=Bartonella pachyuromydis TaxID=931097 RepID=UPI0031ED0D6E
MIAGSYNALLVQYAKIKCTSTKKVLGHSSQYNCIGMFLFSLIGAYFAYYSRQYIWYISAFLMMMTTIFVFFLDDLKGEKKTKHANFVISEIREILSIFIKVPYIFLCFYFSLIFSIYFRNIGNGYLKIIISNVSYFYLGLVFSFMLLSQLLARFLFTNLSERMNFVLRLLLSAAMTLTVAFFEPRKEIAVLLVCMIFYLIKYTYLRV